MAAAKTPRAMRVAHHPMLLIVGVLYLVAHTGIMLQQLTLWLGRADVHACSPCTACPCAA